MRRLIPATLTGRLVVTTVALVAVVGLLVSVFATATMRSYLTDRLDQQLSAALDRTNREFDRQPVVPPPTSDGRGADGPAADGPGDGPGDVPTPIGQGRGTLTAVFDGVAGEGTVVGDGQLVTLSSRALDTLASIEAGAGPRTIDLPALGSYRVIAVSDDRGRTVVAGLPTDDVDETLASLIWWEALLTGVGVVIAGVAGRVLVRRQLQPLRAVAATAHEVAALPLESGAVGRTVRVSDDLTDSGTEVGQVGEALNTLLSHVERSLDARHHSEEQLRQFLADASHELRTPLATIAGYAELVRRTDQADPDQLRRTLSKVESEAARMSSLVGDMLLLARLDAGRPLEQAEVDLTRLVMEAVDDARVVDPDRRWTMAVPDEPVTVTGDEQRLHQAVTNLLTNASRHTPVGTRVEVALEAAPDGVRLTVTDNGPGLDPALVPVVFDRFARGDSSRTRDSGGAGLGTALVQAIAEAHGGCARVTSEPGRTVFTIHLPS